MPTPTPARQALLARAAALTTFLQTEFETLPDVAQLGHSLAQGSSFFALDAMEQLLDSLKAEVQRLSRAAERHAFDSSRKRPRGYRRPCVPALFERLLAPEDAATATSDMSLENLEGALYVLDVVSALYVDLRMRAPALCSAPARPMLLTHQGEPLASVLPPANLDPKQAPALASRLALRVRKLDDNTLHVWPFLAELLRHGFTLLARQVDTYELAD